MTSGREPQLNPDLQRAAEELFAQLLDLPVGHRDAELRRLTEGSPDLEAEVRSLLAVHDHAGAFLDHAEIVAQSLLGEAAPPLAHWTPGTRIGGYTIASRLGSGGMGDVYVARQDRPGRTVALKVIRGGRRAESLIRRFEHEAEVLGLLQHPGIAQVYEAGAAVVDGVEHPFIAMELIKGLPLVAHIESARPDQKTRLALVAAIADAVHHAHQRGVIHRDLKPANILVDISGIPKVLDFGVARASSSALDLTTIETGVGQLVGTLPYMSPEQVAGDRALIDTRTDIYALGVILYQTLTGRLPLDITNRDIPSAVRVIREQAPPPLSTIDRALRGEIQTIVDRCLEKDKNRRYQSAAELAEDLRRYLAGQPILAKQDSAFYILRKAIRQYQTFVAIVSLTVIAAVAFAVYALRQSEIESEQRQIAQDAATQAVAERKRADENALRLADQLRMNIIERGKLFAQAGNLSAAESLIWPQHLAKPTAHSHWALWETYIRMPCTAVLPNQHSGELQSMDLSPDGTIAAAGAENGEVIAWTTSPPTPIFSTRDHPAAVLGLVFSPDGKHLLSTSRDGTILVRTMPDGREVFRTKIDAGLWSAVTLPAAPRWTVLLGVVDGTIREIDPLTGETLRTRSGAAKGAVRLATSASGDVIAAGGDDGLIRIWRNGDLTPAYEARGHTAAVVGLAVSPDGKTMVSGGTAAEQKLRFWSLDETHAAPLAVKQWDNATTRSITFSPDGKRFLAAGYYRCEIWDAELREVVAGPRLGHASFQARWSPDASTIYTVGGNSLRIWDYAQNDLIHHVSAHAGPVLCLEAVGERLFSAGADGLLKEWKLVGRDLAFVAERVKHPGRIRSVVRRGTRLYAGSDNGYLSITDLADPAASRTLNLGRVSPWFIAVDPAEQFIAVSSRDRIIRVFRLADGTLAHELNSAARYTNSVAFSNDGRTLVSCHSGGVMLAWDAQTWTRRASQEEPGGIWSAAAIPGETDLFVIGTWIGTVKLWDLRTNSLTTIAAPHAQLVTSLKPGVFRIAGVSDQPVVVSTSSDGTVSLGDPASGFALATLNPNAGTLSAAVIAGDNTLVTANGNGSLSVFNIEQADRYVAGNRASASK